jgi:GT2 family glycosyltransferase
VNEHTPLTATVAIVSYKTTELAARCRESIGRPTWLKAVHTTYVENLPTNIGYAAALARDLDLAKTPILIACNADVEFPEEGIGPLLELFHEHPRLGVLGPRQRDPRGFIAHAGILEAGSPAGGRSYGQADIGQYITPFEVVAQVSGSIMLIRREAYEQVGGMSNMPRLYYEDAIFCHRLRKAGWEVGYSGLFTFLHRHASSPSGQRADLAREGREAWEAELAS